MDFTFKRLNGGGRTQYTVSARSLQHAIQILLERITYPKELQEKFGIDQSTLLTSEASLINIGDYKILVVVLVVVETVEAIIIPFQVIASYEDSMAKETTVFPQARIIYNDALAANFIQIANNPVEDEIR